MDSKKSIEYMNTGVIDKPIFIQSQIRYGKAKYASGELRNSLVRTIEAAYGNIGYSEASEVENGGIVPQYIQPKSGEQYSSHQLLRAFKNHFGSTDESLFDGLKAYQKEDGNISFFRPEENATRMITGAQRMCMPSPFVAQFMKL
ncbi:branched-chain amino acid aminotransferase 2, chloroplastic-like protein isoform X2 [Tanacetum coccineum]